MAGLGRFPGARILLLGTGNHLPESRSGLPAVPAVESTLTDLRATLIERCGVPDRAVEIGLDLPSVESMGEMVAAAAEAAEGLLVVYYVGHGVVTLDGNLHLATSRTIARNDRAVHTALPYGSGIGGRVRHSNAEHRVVILDCCFSGRALDGASGLGDPDHLAGHTEIPKGFVLTSASRIGTAVAPPGARHTLFSGALIRVLRDGVPDGPPEITLDALWRATVDTVGLASSAMPVPRCRADGGIGQLAVAANPARRAPSAPPPAPSAAPVTSVCPYRGLEGFDVGDARWFRGRDRLAAALIRALGEQFHGRRVATVVVGPSGAGKSSLLRAGLVPGLSRGSLAGLPVRVFDATGDPLRALAVQVASLTSGGVDDVLDAARRDPGEVAAMLPRSVLIIDQFEEAFAGSPSLDLFGRTLGALAAASSGLVVLGVRADAYGRFSEFAGLAPLLEETPVIVSAMTAAEIVSAIERPASDAGLALEDGLTEQLLADLGVDSGSRSREAYEPGRLPLLSHALRATWQHRTGKVLTLAGYRRTGGIASALAATADSVLAAVRAKYGEDGTAIAERILLRLVHMTGDSEPARLRLARERVLAGLDAPAAEQILTMLSADTARLVSTGRDTVALTHDALLRQWPALRDLIERNLSVLRLEGDLRAAADRWFVSRSRRDLYQGDELAMVRGVATRATDLSPDVRSFLDESIAYEGHLARRRRVRFAVAASLSVLLFLTSTALVVMWRRAAEAGRVAVSRQLVAESESAATTDNALAALLAVAAYRMHPDSSSEMNLYRQAGSSFPRRLATAPPSAGRSTGGRLYAARPEGHRVELRYTAGDRLFRTITDPRGDIAKALLSADGRTLATGSYADGIAESEDATVRLWDVATGGLKRTLAAHTGTSARMAFSPDGTFLAYTVNPSSVRLWNVRTGQARTLVDPQPDVNPFAILAFSPDGRTLAYASNVDNVPELPIRLYDVPSGRLRATAAGHTGVVTAIAFGPDGRSFATASEDATARLWATGTGRLLVNLFGHQTRVLSAAFSQDGRTLATGGADGTIRLWSTADGRPRAVLADPRGDTESLRFTADDRHLVAGDDEPKIWDISAVRSRVLIGFPGSPGYVSAVAFSPDGQTLTTAEEYGSPLPDGARALSWDLAHGTVRRHLDDRTGGPARVASSPDGSIVAAPGPAGTLRLWDHSGGRPEVLVRGFRGEIEGVAYLPDGRTLVTINRVRPSDPDSTVVQRYREDTGVTTVAGVPGGITDGWALSPDGSMLTMPRGEGFCVVDLRSGHLRDLAAPHSSALATAFSPDGRTVAAVGTDSPITLWDVAKGRIVETLGGPTDDADHVMFSPDGRNLVTSGSPNQDPVVGAAVRFWDLDLERIRATLPAETRNVQSLAISRDGRTLATGGDDGTVRLWDFGPTSPAAAAARICDAVGRDLTVPERSAHLPEEYAGIKVCPAR